MLALGGSLASSVAEASHLVTDRIRRTVKFLCALGRGIPILSLAWLHEVRSQEMVTDPQTVTGEGCSGGALRSGGRSGIQEDEVREAEGFIP